jgi:hypothetical protein
MEKYRKDELIGTLYAIGAFISGKLIGPTYAYLSKISDDIEKLGAILDGYDKPLHEAFESAFGYNEIKIVYENGKDILISNEDPSVVQVLRKFGEMWKFGKLGSPDDLKVAEITCLDPRHNWTMGGVDFVKLFEKIPYGEGAELGVMKFNQEMAQYALVAESVLLLLLSLYAISRLYKCRHWIKKDLENLWERRYKIKSETKS